MNGMRLTDNDTRLYFRSDSLDQNDELELGYRNEFLRTEIGDEGLSVIGWLYAVGYDETASKLAEQADDWRWMTDAEIEAYERDPLNHGAIASLLPMATDFRQSFVEVECLKALVFEDGTIDPAKALELAKETMAKFQDNAPDQPNVFAFAKAGELKASAPDASVEFIDMGDLTDEENEIITSFAGKLEKIIFDFAAQARCSGNENNPRLLYVLMFKFLEAAAAACLTVAEDDEQPASLEAFHANATQSWMKVKAMGATS